MKKLWWVILAFPLVAFGAQIENGIYFPVRDANGRIDVADFNTVPENTWVRIAGTRELDLRAKLVEAFNARHGTNYTWNQINVSKGTINSALNGWSGCLYDWVREGIACDHIGGHVNGAVNGIWFFSFRTMRWEVLRAPSDPTNWPKEYRETRDQTHFPKAYLPEGFDLIHPHLDILPDGMPTSRHHYLGMFFDTLRGRYCTTRESLWCYTFDTDTYDAQVFFDQDGVFKSSAGLGFVYNEYHDVAWGYLRKKLPGGGVEKYKWYELDPKTGEATKVQSAVRDFGYNGSIRRKAKDSPFVLVIGSASNTNLEEYSLYDLQARAYVKRRQVIEGSVPQDWSNEVPALTYVPEWGRWLRRFTKEKSGKSCRWYLFDSETGVQEAISFDPNPACARKLGNKLTYSEELKALFLIAPGDWGDVRTDQVWVMRPGAAPPGSEVPPPARSDLQKLVDVETVIKLPSGKYYGSARLRHEKHVDFAGVEIVGPESPAPVITQGGPITVRNLTFDGGGSFKSCIWVMHIWDDVNDRNDPDYPPEVIVEGANCSGTWQGIETSNKGGSLTIRNTVITGGSGEFGRGHPVYAGRIDTLDVERLTVNGHKAAGHLLKSRAKKNSIRNSKFYGLDTRHSRIFDFSCGGEIEISDSVMVQSPASDNLDLISIAVGNEVNCPELFEVSTLKLTNTSWTATKAKATFLTTKKIVRVIDGGGNTFEGVEPPEWYIEPDPDPDPVTPPPKEVYFRCVPVEVTP